MTTRNFVPRADGEGSLGTAIKKWGAIYAEKLSVSADTEVKGTLTVGSDTEVKGTLTVGGMKVEGTLNLLKRNAAYAIGDIAYSPNLPSWARLECVQAGTTGDTEPDYAQMFGGVLLTDGTVIWIVDDIRDTTPVGRVVSDITLRLGYIKANGAEVLRADYPRLIQFANAYNLWTDDVVTYPGLYGQGDGDTTFVLPDFRGLFTRYLDDGKGHDINRLLGSYQADALQGHRHKLMESAGGVNLNSSDGVAGAHIPNNLVGDNKSPVRGVMTDTDYGQARIAAENRPKNIATMAVIRY